MGSDSVQRKCVMGNRHRNQDNGPFKLAFPITLILLALVTIIFFIVPLKSPPPWKDPLGHSSISTVSSIATNSSQSVKTKYVLFLGDSWCVSAYYGPIAKVLKSYPINKCAGSTGYLSDGVPKGCGNQCGNYLKQFNKLSTSTLSKVKYVVVSTAGNDGPWLTPELQDNICLTYKEIRIKLPKATIFAVEPFYGYHGKDFYHEIPLAIKKCVEIQGGTYIQGSSDILIREENWQRLFKKNDTHPNFEGSRLLGVEIARAINTALSK